MDTNARYAGLFKTYEEDGYRYAVCRFHEGIKAYEYVDKDCWEFTRDPQNIIGFPTLKSAMIFVETMHRGKFANCHIIKYPRTFDMMEVE